MADTLVGSSDALIDAAALKNTLGENNKTRHTLLRFSQCFSRPPDERGFHRLHGLLYQKASGRIVTDWELPGCGRSRSMIAQLDATTRRALLERGQMCVDQQAAGLHVELAVARRANASSPHIERSATRVEEYRSEVARQCDCDVRSAKLQINRVLIGGSSRCPVRNTTDCVERCSAVPRRSFSLERLQSELTANRPRIRLLNECCFDATMHKLYATSPPEDENDARNWHSQAAYRRRSVHASLVGSILTKISTLVAEELGRRGYALGVFEDDAVWVQRGDGVADHALRYAQLREIEAAVLRRYGIAVDLAVKA